MCKKILKVNHGILIYFNTCSLLTLLFLSFLQFITPFDAPKEFFQGEKLQLSVIKAGRTQLNSEANQCDYRFEWLHLALTFLLSWPGDLSRAWHGRDLHMPHKVGPPLPMVWSPPAGASKYRFSLFTYRKGMWKNVHF